MEHVRSRDGTRIGFSRSGAGPPLVLVHGTTADHTRWSFVAPALEKHFELIAMDRRGRGESEDSPNYSLDREAEDVVAVVEAQQAPVFLLGHSYGGLCSLDAATRTDRVARMVLYEPPAPTGAPMYEAVSADRLEALVDAGRGEDALVCFFREIVRMSDAELDVMRRPPAWERRLAMVATIPRETRVEESYVFDAARIGAVSAPTLVLTGETSPRFLRLAAELVNATLADSRLAVLPGQGHVAMTTAPEQFVGAILPFLTAD